MKKLTCSLLALSLVTAGCATSSADIASAYASPLQFQSYDCAQIALETRRIEQRVVELGGRLDQAASNDKAIMGVGLILFWPALFALGGTKQQEAEYARLKGEYEALQQASIQKKCGAQGTGAAVAASPSSSSSGTNQPEVARRGAAAQNPATAKRPPFKSTIPELVDKSLTLGSKTLILGGDRWFLLGKDDSIVSAQPYRSYSSGILPVTVKAAATTAVEVSDRQLRRIVVFATNTSPIDPVGSWPTEPCKVSETLLIDRFGADLDLPECLYVRSVNTASIAETSPLSRALRWAVASGLEGSTEYFETAYARYSSDGFASVTTFVPAAIENARLGPISPARALATSMRPLAQGARSKAYLPE